MRDGTIAVDGVWKRFRADRQDTRVNAHVHRLGRRLRGDAVGWQWALQDVSLRAEPGEAIGLIGANGSGKTTLLRLVNRVMYPYAGRVSVHGRVGALIEIRAGLHPELRGSENIYFFGSLLGLRRSEIAADFDDIVAFAELEHAIDRQVKFYSSGMQMRLGFAAASFLDPAILLVDEVLAVGDSAFQQRCLACSADLLIAGTTLVFVSHDSRQSKRPAASIWLDGGVVAGPRQRPRRGRRLSRVGRAPIGCEHAGELERRLLPVGSRT